MAVKSMTGFGRGEVEEGGRVWTVETRCVNHRYLDLKMKLPKGYSALEEKIRKKVSMFHYRGRVDLFLGVSGDFTGLMEIKANLGLAREYHDALKDLSQEFGLEDGNSAAILASYPDVLISERKNENLEDLWPILEQSFDDAFKRCDIMRMQEGETLASDLLRRLDIFTTTIDMIESAIPVLLKTREKNLQERLQKILGNVQLDPARLAQEVAVIADKTDVTEEIVRLRCHIQQFELFLKEGLGIGRKLDFLIQEFLREVNTLASKINDAAIAHHTVELKSELEKMREQVQNIE
jgi:uncharacterized protein (TIGR00255 family)